MNCNQCRPRLKRFFCIVACKEMNDQFVRSDYALKQGWQLEKERADRAETRLTMFVAFIVIVAILAMYSFAKPVPEKVKISDWKGACEYSARENLAKGGE